MHLVSKRTTELNELIGSEADRLTQQLFEAPDWPSRFVVLDNFLLSKLTPQLKQERNYLGIDVREKAVGAV
jgi:hypothetical protein